MKRIKFTRAELYESEGRGKGPTFEAGSVHNFEDAFADRWLRRNSAIELGDEPAAPPPPTPNSKDDEAPALADHTVAQLRDIAEKEEIDLSDVTLKADIIATIELAREEKAEG